MTDPHKPDSKAADFLAAALRQKQIEDQVSAQGEHVRADLERQSILDQGGAAAKALLKEEKRQQDIGALRTFIDTEIGAITSVLARLPADDDNRTFRITSEVSSGSSTSITVACHYANDAQAQNHLILAKTTTPGFRLSIYKSTSKDATGPTLYFYDYTRMVAKDNDGFDPYTVTLKEPAELRTLIGTFLARATPQRLDEVMALLAPQEYAAQQKPPALSKAVTLSAPALPFDVAAKPAPAQDVPPPAKKTSLIKTLLRRKK